MKKLLGKILGKLDREEARKVHARSPRVRIPLIDQAVFISANGKSYLIQNLSETGLALLSPGERFADEVNGEVLVGGQRAYVELLTVRRSGDQVGVTFGEGAGEVRGLLRRIFGDEIHALSMTEIDASKQKPVPEGKPRWFYAPGNYELFFVEHEGKITRFELEWNGTLIAWSADGLRQGSVERDFKDAVAHTQAALVKWQDEVTDQARRKALRLLENIPGLDAGVRSFLQERLKD